MKKKKLEGGLDTKNIMTVKRRWFINFKNINNLWIHVKAYKFYSRLLCAIMCIKLTVGSDGTPS